MQLTVFSAMDHADRGGPHLLMGDFNTLAPNDYDERPGDLDALRSVEWVHRMMAEDFQVVPRLMRRGYVDAAGAAEAFTHLSRRCAASAYRLHLGVCTAGFGRALVSSLAD